MSTPTDEPAEPTIKKNRARALVERLRRGREGGNAAEELAREQNLRRQAEAARGMLRAIFESVPGSCIVLTPDDEYRIVGVTEAYLEATMTRRAEILERPLFEVFPEDPDAPTDSAGLTRASLARVRETLASDVVGVTRYPIPRPPGEGGGFEERYWSSINAPVLTDDGALAYIIHRVEDVTEYVRGNRAVGDSGAPGEDARRVRMRMEAEIVRRTLDLQAANQRLRESEARYYQLIQALPAGVYTCDAQGRVLLYNRNALELWGREPEPGRTFWCGSWRLYRRDGSELPHETCPMAQAVKEERPVRGEVVVERPDGRRAIVQVNATPTFGADGQLTGAINLVLDVTAQARAEEAQARLAALVDSSDDAIVSKDLDGVVQSWNGGAERIFGYSAEEMIGQPIARIIPSELRDEEERILAKIRRGERLEHFETVRATKDGRKIDVSLRISPIHDSAGHVIGASKIARDITETKRVAMALADADRRKDQFLAMLAHELRNPLAAIASGVELLALPGGPRQLESTRRMMDRQTRHLTHLVEDLMDMSRISRGMVRLRCETLDARYVAERAIETVRPTINAQRHALRVTLDEQPVWVHADATRLEQVTVNLLTNAAKFTKPGGLIEVEALRKGDSAVLTVRDNGVGISKDLLPRVFELFAQSEQSVDRATGGLGIGLTLVKSIAEMHGGTAEARSEGQGRGAEFSVTLPALGSAPDAGRRSSEESPRLLAGSAKPRRVLVVDDNQDAALGLARLLEFSGHLVRQAYTGPAALQSAAEFRPEVVLLDIGLPDLDGYEVARRLRADPAQKDVVIIALSGYCQDEDRRRSREAGCDHHVAKPVGHRELLRLLDGPEG